MANPQSNSDTSHILTAITTLSDRNLYDASDADNGHRMAAIIRSGKSLPIIDFTRAQRFARKYRDLLTPQTHVFKDESNRSGLNEQQLSAFDGVVNWFSDRYASRQSLLVGYAGTGKTYTVQRIAKELQQTKKICFTSPTHKANQVLSKMAHEADLTVDVMTIHSLLGLSLKYDKFGKQRLIQKGEDKSYNYDFVVLDEGSMAGQELYDFIRAMQSRCLVMGDPCQLPDVETGLESPVFTQINTRWDLTKVVRYDGAIYRRVTDIRENIKSKRLPFAKYERGVFDKFDSGNWMQNLIERYKVMLQNEVQDSTDIRALAWTNKRVQEINMTVRTALYGDHALPYIHNERLVAKDLIELQHPDGDWKSGYTWATGSNSVLMHSCDECVIKHYRQGTKRVFDTDFEGWYLDVLTDLGDRATIFVVDESEKSKVMTVCGGRKKAILETHLENRERADMWRLWYKGLNELGLKSSGNSFMRKLQYAFALTVHQSQGSTFKTVFADVSNVFGCQDVELRNKLLYVQLSRASQELYELNNF